MRRLASRVHLVSPCSHPAQLVGRLGLFLLPAGFGLVLERPQGPVGLAPAGLLERGVPGVVFGGQLLDDFGLVGRQVLLLADIGGQVEQHPLLGPAALDELHVAVADGHLVAEPPVERVVRRRGDFAFQVRQQVDAVELGVLGFDSGCGQSRRMESRAGSPG